MLIIDFLSNLNFLATHIQIETKKEKIDLIDSISSKENEDFSDIEINKKGSDSISISISKYFLYVKIDIQIKCQINDDYKDL